MKKSFKRMICLLLAATTVLPLAACGGDGDNSTSSSGSSGGGNKVYKNDPEKRPVVFATDSLDGNFNPFFATSAGDSEMASMTQLGMLTTDEDGNIVSGENEPTVALSHKVTEAADQLYTDYEFVIKNGIKFSSGVDLTIKDVLFNLYVYLDPSYMGSATMYSTDIQGLKKYRAQDPDLIEDNFSESSLNSEFYGTALARQQDMIYYLDGDSSTVPSRTEEKILADIEEMKKLFKEEVESDWTMSQGSLEGYKDEYTFTESWQVYLFNEGLVKIQYNNTTGKPLREKSEGLDENNKPKVGKYVTNITPYGCTLEDGSTYLATDPLYQGRYNEELVNSIKAVQNDQTKLDVYINDGVSVEDAKLFVTRDFATKTVYDSYTLTNSSLKDILNYWATGANLLDKFIAEARTEKYESLKGEDGSLAVKTISGISVDTKDINGEKHYVLKIRINGIDPKAIYNFAFAVAPMSYYSGTFKNAKGVTKDYVKAAMDEMKTVDPKNWTEFGVAFNDNKFFDTVLQDDAKTTKPVGAGAYQVSNQKGEVGDTVKGSQFHSNGWVYFARNDYFTNVGDKIENAKIKYLRYKVTNSDLLIQSLQAKNIDVGEPNATATNVTLMDSIDHIEHTTVDTNGYGYVGINPKYVPDLWVRRAIMSTLQTSNCLAYYSSKYASLIFRSMSKASWIWKYGDQMPNEPYYTLTDFTVEEIQQLVAKAGWKPGANGKLQHDDRPGETLKFTFTIAGATTDHPAYTMFSEAAYLLNQAGFDITVATDIQALKKLASGQLAVWAAAWSSTVDPDMYQVYHKDSNATSTKNWGYDTIFGSSDFVWEQDKINDLSLLIEQGRETNDQETRAGIYKQALDIVMELAVEMPTYQRKDCLAYNKEIIDENSLNDKPTPFAGIIDKIWELDYV